MQYYLLGRPVNGANELEMIEIIDNITEYK